MAGGLLDALGLKTNGAPPPAAQGMPAPPTQGMPAPPAEALAAPPAVAPAPGTASKDAWTPPSPDGDFSPRVKKPGFLDFDDPKMKAAIAQVVEEGAEKDRKEAEQTLAKMDKLLKDVEAYVGGMPGDALARSSYAGVMKDVRKRFPEAANLSQWVKQTQHKVPEELKRRLPKPQALMEAVEKAVNARGAQHGWAISTGKDLKTLATDRLLAAYAAELPANISVDIEGGVVKLGLEGAALTVQTPAGQVEASAGKEGASAGLKNDNLTIKVENEGWKEFDPELRAQWQKIGDATSIVVKLKADLDKLKLELEQKKKSGQATADLELDVKKREATFNLAWKTLQEKITVAAKASEEKITASIEYLKKKGDKTAVQAGIDAEVDLKALEGKLEAYYKTPSVEGALELTAAADKVAAKLELTAVKTGVVVTANFERSLEETKAALEVLIKESKTPEKTKIAVELKHKADELSAKLKVVHERKDLKLAAELEKTLKDVRGSVEVEYKKGNITAKGGASASSSGEVGGKAQIDIALQKGLNFVEEGAKLSFTASVSNQRYAFGVSFSMGEPVETASLQDLFKDVDTQIKELYKLVGDKGVRSIEDAALLNKKLQDVMKPIKDSASKAKTLKKKSEISASFGFSIEGEWPAGGKASAPAVMGGLTLRF